MSASYKVDMIPIRLPSGSKAVVYLPDPFPLKDALHMMEFLSLYIQENIEAEPTPPKGQP